MKRLPTLASSLAIAAAIAAGACGDKALAPEGSADAAAPPAAGTQKRETTRLALFTVGENWTDALEPSERIRVARAADSLSKRAVRNDPPKRRPH